MKHFNVEIKAKCSNHGHIRNVLKSQNAIFVGNDHQIDTYFNVDHGGLKLRKGKIENFLVFYEREEKKGPKRSNVVLFKTELDCSLRDILVKSLGILVVVEKRREIYYIDNVKFHLDTVRDLGTFVEIEAINKKGAIGKADYLKCVSTIWNY